MSQILLKFDTDRFSPTFDRTGEGHASLQGEVLHTRGRLAYEARPTVVQRGHRSSPFHQVNIYVFHQVDIHVFHQVNIDVFIR